MSFRQLPDGRQHGNYPDGVVGNSSCLVLGLYRERDGARRLHEHGVLARFRYNDLKEAARAADAGAMQIEWSEGPVLSRAETVLQGTTHDTMRVEIG